MNIARMAITALSCVALSASSASPQPTMTFCELIQHPEKYNGQLVKVRATWIYGYEWTYLHCLDCDAQVWLETEQLDEESKKAIKHMPKWTGIVNVDVEGVFETGRTFGHMNGYKYQLKAEKIANPTVLSKGTKAPEKEREIERQFACGGTNPR
jgi:hypothetical protein